MKVSYQTNIYSSFINRSLHLLTCVKDVNENVRWGFTAAPDIERQILPYFYSPSEDNFRFLTCSSIFSPTDGGCLVTSSVIEYSEMFLFENINISQMCAVLGCCSKLIPNHCLLLKSNIYFIKEELTLNYPRFSCWIECDA